MELPEEPDGCPGLKDISAAFAGPTSLRPSLWLPADGQSSTLYFSPKGSTFTPVAGYTPPWVTTELIAAQNTGQTSDSTTTGSAGDAEPTTDSEDSDDSGGGLSTGAKAGIGAGVGAAGVGIIVAAIVLFRRKRKDQAEKPGEPGSTQPMMGVGGTAQATRARARIPPRKGSASCRPGSRQPCRVPTRAP